MKLSKELLSVWFVALACLMNWCPSARAYDWQPPPNKITVLAVFAHPDDEGIFFGGALPYYSSVLNLPTMLLCMADGNETLRQDELRCAAWSYGLRYEPLFGHFANFLSAWITNSPYTNSTDITWDLWADGVFQGDGSDVEAGKTRAINCVAEAIRRYRPDVIITQDVNGETGHDNHKAASYATMQAFFVAADPNVTATNLVGLPPWQAQKLYVHLYPTNRLFHKAWEIPYQALTNLTAHQAAHVGLSCHVSQGPSRWVCASVYPPGGDYTAWPAEWWGLYASTMGPDTVLSSNATVNGYGVPSGVALGNFLEHISLGPLSPPPVFMSNPVIMPLAATYDSYTGPSLADYVLEADSSSTLTFGKISGPDWLRVSADGTLAGTPSRSDAGTNSWVVGVTNQLGVSAQTTLIIPLLGRPIGLENLVGWWKLSETNPASPAAANSAPVSPDGVSYGGTTFGQPGARPWTHFSAQFNGTDGKIEVPYTAALNPPVFTVAFWANVAGGSGTYRSPLTSRKIQSPAGYMFYAAINNVWQFRAGNGSAWNILNAGPVVANTWIHLAATYDGTNTCFYTNGSLAASAMIAVQPNDTFPLRIGAGATEGPGGFWFPGRVDDVRIYRVALDAAHVSALCNSAPVISSIGRLSDGTMQLGGNAVPGETYILLASSSRTGGPGWAPVATNGADINGYVQFIDADTITYPQRFYRLAMP